MQIRDRVKQLMRVKASALRPHPNNWRVHPAAQRDALRGVLAEIGYAGALLARELPDGALELIDGHLRAETTPEVEVPVLVVDLDRDEAAKLLAVGDPLAAMAEANDRALAELLAGVETGSEALRALLDRLEPSADTALDGLTSDGDDGADEPELPEVFQVVVDCRDESEQRALYERLAAEGYSCRVVTL